jgi:hypothetical protein
MANSMTYGKTAKEIRVPQWKLEDLMGGYSGMSISEEGTAKKRVHNKVEYVVTGGVSRGDVGILGVDAWTIVHLENYKEERVPLESKDHEYSYGNQTGYYGMIVEIEGEKYVLLEKHYFTPDESRPEKQLDIF